MAMVLAIYRTTRSLSGNFNKEVSSQNTRGAAKHSVVSQMTIFSDLDPTSEVLDTLSQPVFSDEEQMSPFMPPNEIAFQQQSSESDDCKDDTPQTSHSEDLKIFLSK